MKTIVANVEKSNKVMTMMKKTAKAISPDMMLLLTYFMFFSYFLLNLEPSHGQSKNLNMLLLIGLFLLLSSLILFPIAFWINHKNNVEKPLFNIDPKQLSWRSFFIAGQSFFLFLKTIVDDNRIPYIGYLTFFLFLIICYILKVNKRYYREEQEMANDLKMKEEHN